MPNTPNSAPKDVSRFFDAVSSGYDIDWIQRWGYRPAQDAILRQLGSHEVTRVVDVGCGTGILAARVQATLQPDEVTGIDPSEGMLANARKRSTAVDWLVGAAEDLPLANESVDAVTTSTAFHFFDQPAALAEFHRVLAPGGIVVVGSIIQPSARPRDLCGILARCTPAGYLATDTVPDLLTTAGFRVVSRDVIDSWASGWPLFYRVTVGVK